MAAFAARGGSMSRQAQSIGRAAAIVGVAMVLSRILGFFRNSAIAALFGQGLATDAFYAAYLVPDTIYLILIGGGVSSAFIPVLTRYLSEDREDEVWRVTSIAFNVVAVGLVIVLGLGMLLAPWYLHLILPGFGPQKLALTTELTRITLASIFFHGLNGVLIGTEYTYSSFLGTAVGPLIYNVAIIVVGIILAGPFGIAAFAWSTLIGAFLNFLVQVWGVLRLHPQYLPSLNLHHEGIRRIFRLMLPVAFGMSLAQINLLVNQSYLASTLPQGSVNALTLASRVELVPVMFAISVGITLLPNLSRQAAARDMQAFRRSFSDALRIVLFVTIPASLGLLLLAEPIVEVLFQHGAFNGTATLVTSSALIYYSVGITGYAAYEILARAFYALSDTRTPVVIGMISLVAGIILNFLLVHLFSGPHGAGGERGLALAYSLTGLLNAWLLLNALRRRAGPLQGRRTARTAVRALLAGVGMVAVVYLSEHVTPFLMFGPSLLRGLIELLWPMLVGVAAYFAIARLLGAEEVAWLMGIIARRLRRA
jgi:putative peptidoglycan lipid II flippase